MVVAWGLVGAGSLSAATESFANAASITILDAQAATPYPSQIDVSGMEGTITNVTVTLSGLNHTWLSDVDVLLVGPAGQMVLIFSDVGDGFNLRPT